MFIRHLLPLTFVSKFEQPGQPTPYQQPARLGGRASGQRQPHAIPVSLCEPENKQENENKYSQGIWTQA